MSDRYIWEYVGFGPTVGVTKEPKGSIFLKDKKFPYKAWWNGCGISEGTRTLEESKRICIDYVRQYAEEAKKGARRTIRKANKALAELREV